MPKKIIIALDSSESSENIARVMRHGARRFGRAEPLVANEDDKITVLLQRNPEVCGVIFDETWIEDLEDLRKVRSRNKKLMMMFVSNDAKSAILSALCKEQDWIWLPANTKKFAELLADFIRCDMLSS